MIAGLALAAVLGLACAAGPAGAGAAVEQQAFETILAAAHSGLHDRTREIVRDEAGWARLWAEIHGSDAPAVPPVDFSRQMLIVVALGTRPSGGFGIRVGGVATRGDRLEVAVLESCPPPGAMVTAALTQPVEVVRVARLSQAPTFQDRRGASCR